MAASLRRVELTPLLAAACAGLAAWISLGSLAVATSATDSRFGWLPSLWLAPVLMIAFGMAAWILRVSRARSLPLFFSLVLLLPWIPGPVPEAFLLWTGPVVVAVWSAVAVGMVAAGTATRPLVPPSSPGPVRPASVRPAALALVVYLFGAWWLSPILPAGDEPHYLVIAESLLRDGDLRVENNYAEERYREYYGDTMRPHYIKRGVNGEIYSIHAPGLPALVAPAFALFGYPGVVVWLALIAAAGSALLWRAAYHCARDASAAWFAWAAGALSAPMFFEAFSVFPDGLGATVVLFAALPLFEDRLTRARWVATGAALALLPWLHTRLAIVSAMLGGVLLLRLVGSAEGRSKIAPFLVVPLGSAIAWFGFFRAIYGQFDPSAPYGQDTQTSAMNVLNGFPALLVDQQFGVLPNAPVYGFCLVGLVVLARRRTRLAIELVAVALPYVLAVSAFHMWWGGTAAPARFLAPILPLMAVPAAWLWSATPHMSTRAVGAALLFASLAATAFLAGAEHGVLAYNVRDGYARVADWMNPVVDLSLGLPSFFRHASGGVMWRAAIWVGFFAAAAVGLRMLERRGGTRAMLALATPVSLALAMMGALTAVWAADGVAAPNPERSQLSLVLDYGTRRRPYGVMLQPPVLETAEAILEKVALASPTRRAPLPDRTLLLLPEIVPAGVYALQLTDQAHGSGAARLVIGRLARPSKAWDLGAEVRDGSATLQLPVDVGSLVIAGDRGAPTGALALRPVRIWEGSSRLTNDIARRVERQGPAVVFFFDVNVFPEEPGFWVRGGRETQVAVMPADDGRPLQMFVRNAAAANQVRLEIDGVPEVLDLQPREERLRPLPVAGHRPGALIRIHSQSGFNPSEVEPGSKDTRFLGVWVEFR